MTSYKKQGSILVELINEVANVNAVIGYTAYTVEILPDKYYKFDGKILQNITLCTNQKNSVKPHLYLHTTQMDLCSIHDQDEIDPCTFSEVIPYSKVQAIPQASNPSIAEYWYS